ncbi:MAG TPA: serine/threonine-protein kinase [Rudaea sp.]|jgi:hypothetical protein|nr:serine/threonine-protein kinase [Rudaea sp.]
MDAQERDQWRAADQLFQRLIELDDAERRRVLETVQVDAGVHAKLAQLLDSSQRSHRILDGDALNLPWHAAGPVPPNADGDRLLGRCIGNWKLVEAIGRGGMGVVYRAERVGADYDQRAAIKLLAIALHADAEVQRFRRERRILAQLQHPHVAGLIDAGVAEDGTPYLAMALIDGVRIDGWCERQGASLRARVELMLQVCDAVAYAHRQLIVHRDIKPGNVLVDAKGQATLLDFGIARLLDADDTGEQTVTRAFTPDYAAPEQRRGERALGTAVDVYGLGAVLYRLLAGAAPACDAKGEVAPASRVARERGDARGAALLRGDLDAILAQALAEVPTRRYASVDALANDLQAWLHHRPLRAQRATVWTRLRKFVRRNRAASVLALIAILAAGAGFASFILSHRALERRAAQLQAVTKFQTDMLMQFAPDRAGASLHKAVADALGKTVPAANTAATVLNRIDYTGLSIDMLDEAILAPSIDAAHQRFSDQPRVKGMLLLALTEAYLGLGRFDKARALQEQVTALARERFGAEDRLTLMSLRDEMKWVRQAKSPDGEAISRDIVHQHERYLGVNDIDTAIARGLLGEWLMQHGKTTEAESILRDSGTRIARERGQDDPDAVSARANLAFAISSQGRYAESVPLYRSAAESMVKVFGADHPYTLTSLNNLAYALNHSGHGDEALPIYRRVFEARRRVLGAKHRATLISENNLAVGLGRQGQNAEAEPLQREVYAGFRDTLGAHDATTLHAGLNLARNELALRHHADVDALVAELLEGWQQPRDAKPIAQAQRILAQSLQGQGKYEAAATAFEQSWQAATIANDAKEQRETAQAALAPGDKANASRHSLWQQRSQAVASQPEKPSAASDQ